MYHNFYFDYMVSEASRHEPVVFGMVPANFKWHTETVCICTNANTKCVQFTDCSWAWIKAFINWKVLLQLNISTIYPSNSYIFANGINL